MQLAQSSSWKERERQRKMPPSADMISKMRAVMDWYRQEVQSSVVPNYIFVGRWSVLGWKASSDGLDIKGLQKQEWFRNLSRYGKKQVSKIVKQGIKESKGVAPCNP